MIIWDDEKDLKLQAERNISLGEVAEIILKKEFLDILENPSRPNQQIFVIKINDYIHAVPFLIDDEANIVLKTAYPSRKLHKIYMEEEHDCQIR